jgi:hypothetical protein
MAVIVAGLNPAGNAYRDGNMQVAGLFSLIIFFTKEQGSI